MQTSSGGSMGEHSLDVEYLDVQDLLYLAGVLSDDPAGATEVNDVGLLSAAAARPLATVSGVDAYPALWLKAAALLESLVRGRALAGGNERLGWLATAVFLEINGVDTTFVSADAAYDLVRSVASGDIPVATAAERLGRLVGRDWAGGLQGAGPQPGTV